MYLHRAKNLYHPLSEVQGVIRAICGLPALEDQEDTASWRKGMMSAARHGSPTTAVAPLILLWHNDPPQGLFLFDLSTDVYDGVTLNKISCKPCVSNNAICD